MRHLPCSAMCALNHTGRMYGRAGAAAIDWTTISLSQRSSSGHQRCNILNLVRGKLFDIDWLILTKCHGLKWHGFLFLFVCLFVCFTPNTHLVQEGEKKQDVWKNEVIQESDFKRKVPQKLQIHLSIPDTVGGDQSGREFNIRAISLMGSRAFCYVELEWNSIGKHLFWDITAYFQHIIFI